MKFISPLILILLLTSCGSVKNKSDELQTLKDREKSSLEIVYLMGHNRYRFIAFQTPTEVSAQSLLNEKIVEQQPIAKAGYLELLAEAQSFVVQMGPLSREFKECKSPFRISVKYNDDFNEARGCRHQDTQGKLGQLIRKGELLLARP